MPHDAIAAVGRLLDTYAATHACLGPAEDDPEDGGVPPAMRVGPVDDDGWVAWQMLPSTLSVAALAALEGDYGVRIPPALRAYLLARFHCFDEAHSRQHDQPVLLCPMPCDAPLLPLRDLWDTWQPLLAAGYLPFLDWGAGLGPLCADTRQTTAEGECPFVWFEHEALFELGPAGGGQRASVEPLAQPLYPTCWDLLSDIFGSD